MLSDRSRKRKKESRSRKHSKKRVKSMHRYFEKETEDFESLMENYDKFFDQQDKKSAYQNHSRYSQDPVQKRLSKSKVTSRVKPKVTSISLC